MRFFFTDTRFSHFHELLRASEMKKKAVENIDLSLKLNEMKSYIKVLKQKLRDLKLINK
jgi:hypothetical protein